MSTNKSIPCGLAEAVSYRRNVFHFRARYARDHWPGYVLLVMMVVALYISGDYNQNKCIHLNPVQVLIPGNH